MVLGNDRMTSAWPARGGPVVLDNVVYFAAGVWPTDGFHLHALEARTGKPLWSNRDTGSLYMPQPHAGAYGRSGVAAQAWSSSPIGGMKACGWSFRTFSNRDAARLVCPLPSLGA